MAWLPVLASAAAWVIVFTAIPPSRQDFPLDDDWSFARGAIRFFSDGEITYSHWAAMPQLGQWLWAWPFIRCLGSSHVTLRAATIILSWFGLWGFVDLLRQEGMPPLRAAFAATALALDPLFFLLQGTFMTDVPSLAFSLVALACYVRAIRNSALYLMPATVAALLAVSTRQNTLLVLVAAGLAAWHSPRWDRRLTVWGALLIPIAVGLGIAYWFRQRPDILLVDPHPPAPYVLVLFPFMACVYLGLASVPVLVLNRRRGAWWQYALALGLLSVGVEYWRVYAEYLPFGGWFPYASNLLTPYGAFQFFYLGERPVVLGLGIRIALTLVGCMAGAGLLVRFLERLRQGLVDSPLIVLSLLQVPLILLAPLFDRYLLFLLPGALDAAGVRKSQAQPATAWAVVLLVIMGGVSVALMHDWLAWNSARWELGRRAVASGIAPKDIEGGFEWDGWYTQRGGASRTGPVPGLTLSTTYHWFPEVTGRYALAFSPVPGSAIVDRAPYRLWLLPGEHFFYLLKYQPPKG